MANKKALIAVFLSTLVLGAAAVGLALWFRRPQVTTTPEPSEAQETPPGGKCCLKFSVTEEKGVLACESVSPKAFSVRGGESRDISVSAKGGQPPYQFSWKASGGKLSKEEGEKVSWTAPKDASASSVFTISAKVKDAKGGLAESESCQATATVSVSSGLTCDSVSPKNFTVVAGESKDITVTSSGGTPPYSYSWRASGGTLSSLSGKSVTWTAPSNIVAEVTYKITASVTDAKGEKADSKDCESKARVSVSGVSKPDCLSLTANKSSGKFPLSVSFSTSSEGEHEIVSFEFDFGDGNSEKTTKSSVSHTYQKSGTFVAKVRMKDSEGQWSADGFDAVEEVCKVTISPTAPEVPPQGGSGLEASPSVPDTGVFLQTLILIFGGLSLVVLGSFSLIRINRLRHFEAKF